MLTLSRPRTYERLLDLTASIEEAVSILAENADSTTGMGLLQAAVEPLVNEVDRIESFIANVEPLPLPAVARATTLLRQGLEAYLEGALHLAECLEDLDFQHLAEARWLFQEGHLTLQAARDSMEDSWESEAAAA